MNMLKDNPESLAGAYLAMAQLFSYPDEGGWRRLAGRGLVDAALTREALESEYLAVFEMGGGASPVSLYEGQNRPELGRDGILQDLLRYYEYFDAHLNQDEREYPDHLVTELEFLAWLCLQEHRAEREGRDAEAFRRAARDFLARHLAAWLPEFSRKLGATDTTYAQCAPLLVELVDTHQRRLAEQLEPCGEQQ
ncbi:MAG: molecular chaperone TorD family protein [Ramlibacter sp.]